MWSQRDFHEFSHLSFLKTKLFFGACLLLLRFEFQSTIRQRIVLIISICLRQISAKHFLAPFTRLVSFRAQWALFSADWKKTTVCSYAQWSWPNILFKNYFVNETEIQGFWIEIGPNAFEKVEYHRPLCNRICSQCEERVFWLIPFFTD